MMFEEIWEQKGEHLGAQRAGEIVPHTHIHVHVGGEYSRHHEEKYS